MIPTHIQMLCLKYCALIQPLSNTHTQRRDVLYTNTFAESGSEYLRLDVRIRFLDICLALKPIQQRTCLAMREYGEDQGLEYVNIYLYVTMHLHDVVLSKRQFYFYLIDIQISATK
jgi:hypothetical protein